MNTRFSPRRSTLSIRRENLANREARQIVGVMYGVLSLHIDPRLLKRSLDWRGVIENISIALRRYAEGEAGSLLRGGGRVGRPARLVR